MEYYISIIGYKQSLLARQIGNRATEKRLRGRGDREPVCLIDASTVSIGLCVRRTQVDLSGCDVGMPKFLPQGLDVNAVLMPPRGIQHPKSVADVVHAIISAEKTISITGDLKYQACDKTIAIRQRLCRLNGSCRFDPWTSNDLPKPFSTSSD
jgi:hypothetical protein